MVYYWRFWEPWANAMLAILLPKLWFGLKIMTGTTVFACLPGAHSPLLDPKKLQNEQFYIIDWIRKKLLVDVANLAPCCHDDYDVLLEVLGTLGKCYVSNPVAKTLVWIEHHDWHNCFCMSSWGSPLLDPKKLQNEQFYIIDWIRKKLLVDVANLAPCCHDDYDVLLEVLGTLGKCYVSNPVAKTLVWIENHDWHNCFCMSSWGSPLLDPKKLQNEQFYIIDWIRKKLLVDVANLAPCCLLLLAAPCCCLLLLTCCLPAAAHLLLTPTRCIGITTRGDTQGKQKTSIAFLPSRILARSVSFSCQVSTHRSFWISISWGMHKLFPQRRRMLCLWVGAQRAQNLLISFSPGRTTVPDAMLMSRCQSWSMLC